MTENATFIKKITQREVGCESKIGQSFVVMGRLMRAKAAETSFGPYTRFGGQFLAINEKTGKEFQSAAFIPPGIGEDVLYSALQAAQEHDATASVEFAMRFKSVKDTGSRSSAMGYVWQAEMLHKPATDDPTDRLREAIKEKLQIAASKPAA